MAEKQKYTDLVDLYQGKREHEKALKLLKRLGEEEDDKLDRLGPVVRYLQKMGSDWVDLILRESEWVFEQDKRMGLDVSSFCL